MMLAQGVRQKAHFDLEYHCDPKDYDAERAYRHLVIVLSRLSRALLEAFAQQLQGANPIFGITEGTRRTKEGSIKVSYHACVQNLFFQSPNGLLGAFARLFVATEKEKWGEQAVSEMMQGAQDPGLERLLHEVPSHEFLDLSVYSRFQQMRMPLSYKCGDGSDPTVLRGLHDSFDPLLSSPRPRKPDPYDADDVDAHRNLFLTWINSSCNDTSFVESHTVLDRAEIPVINQLPGKALRGRGGRTRPSLQKTERLTENKVPEEIKSFVEECMRELSDHRVRGNILSYPSHYVIPLLHVCGSASVHKCPLLGRQLQHKSNNQYVSIPRMGPSKCKLFVRCHSQRCKGRSLPIGTLPAAMLELLDEATAEREKGEAGGQNGSEEDELVPGGEAESSDDDDDDAESSDSDAITTKKDSGSSMANKKQKRITDSDDEEDNGKVRVRAKKQKCIADSDDEDDEDDEEDNGEVGASAKKQKHIADSDDEDDEDDDENTVAKKKTNASGKKKRKCIADSDDNEDDEDDEEDKDSSCSRGGDGPGNKRKRAIESSSSGSPSPAPSPKAAPKRRPKSKYIDDAASASDDAGRRRRRRRRCWFARQLHCA